MKKNIGPVLALFPTPAAVRALQVVLTADEVRMLEDTAESTGVDTRGSSEMPMI